FGGDGADALGPLLDVVDTPTGGERTAIDLRHVLLGIARKDQAAAKARLGAVEFVDADAVGNQPGQFGVHRGFDFGQGVLALWHAVDGKAAGVIGAAIVAGAGLGGGAGFDHHLLIEPAAAAAAKNLGEQVKRFGFAGLGGAVGRHDPGAQEAGQTDARIV